MDFSSINLALFIPAMVIGAIVIAFHILSLFIKDSLVKPVVYMNVGLHVPFIVLIALSGAPIIFGVCSVLASLLVYMASQYVIEERIRRAGREEKEGEV